MNMAHLTKCSILRSIGGWQAACMLLSLAASLLAAQAACAQQTILPPRDDAIGLYRAFYYRLDATNKPELVHIEKLRDLSGRTINALPRGFSVPAAPATPPAEATAVIGEDVVFAVYYGIDFAKPRPRVGRPKAGEDKVVATPLGVEWLSDRDIGRAIQCADPPGDTCQWPRMCHCGAIGGCCCY
jgi:hypothetical protein